MSVQIRDKIKIIIFLKIRECHQLYTYIYNIHYTYIHTHELTRARTESLFRLHRANVVTNARAYEKERERKRAVRL